MVKKEGGATAGGSAGEMDAQFILPIASAAIIIGVMGAVMPFAPLSRPA